MPDQQSDLAAGAGGASADSLASGAHEHTFGQQHEKAGERRTRWVIALTGVTMVIEIAAGMLLQLSWMDPAMRIIGALLVARWSWGLLCDSGSVLLDRQAEPEITAAINQAIVEPDHGTRITDLHVWAIGPSYRAAIIAITSASPRTPADYRRALPHHLGLVHVTIEVEPGPLEQ
jgi:Co/Zn/Cd efflux system component